MRSLRVNVQNLISPSHEDGADTDRAFEGKLASLVAVIDSWRQ
jgi:hypothetical protein